MASVPSLLRQCAKIATRSISQRSRNVQLMVVPCAIQVKRDYSMPKTHSEVRALTNAEWQQRLTPEQYSVCREQCTEPPFSGKYVSHHEAGTYCCTCCGTEVFSSEKKYDSGTGWPSFSEAYGSDSDSTNVMERPDNSHGMFRTEVLCRTCDSHLGHVFEDGPPPSGLRYCINSLALKFVPK